MSHHCRQYRPKNAPYGMKWYKALVQVLLETQLVENGFFFSIQYYEGKDL